MGGGCKDELCNFKGVLHMSPIYDPDNDPKKKKKEQEEEGMSEIAEGISLSGALKNAGFDKEVSTIGDRPIYIGVYKCIFKSWEDRPDGKYGPSLFADFKITEVLLGMESRSTFPELTGFFDTSPSKIASKRNGLAKLINGLFSVGVDIDVSTDETLKEGLKSSVGTQVFIKAYKKQKMKPGAEEGTWEEVEGEFKQGWVFLTEKNAKKAIKKAEKSGDAPF